MTTAAGHLGLLSLGSCVWVSEETSAADKLSQGLQRLTGAAKDPAIHNCTTLPLTSMPGGWSGSSGPLIEPSLTCNSMRHLSAPLQGR